MKDLRDAATEIEGVLQQLVMSSRFDLRFRVLRHPGEVPEICVEFTGPDVELLTNANGELLRAIKEVAAEIRAQDRPELLVCTVTEGRFSAEQPVSSSTMP